MARGGRPRKQGKRDAKGKLRPVIMPDKGNHVTAVKFERFGTDGADPIGRAYRAGLLGPEAEGKALMDAARKIRVAHEQSGVKVGKVSCALNQDRGGVMYVEADPESARRRQDRMFDSLWAAGPRGTMASCAFYGLVVHDEYSDFGPDWLDRLIWGGATKQDQAQLDAAVEALKKIAA